MPEVRENTKPVPDRELVSIVNYVANYRVRKQKTFDIARLRLIDTIACALDALAFPDCTKLLGPVVPGTVVPNGARVPGTAYVLDPVKATFDFGSLIRWLDYNDTFTAAQGSHPSDNLAGALSVADYLSRTRVAAGRKPLVMREVLEALIKCYEIQGCIAIENDFNAIGVDHVILTRVATAAVATKMLGGSKDEIFNAVSNAWMDVSLRVYRQAPNAGWRKRAASKAGAEGVALALMATKGEMGYPSVLSAKKWGFYDTHAGGKAFSFQRPYGEYIIANSMFKFVAAGMHGQSAAECALRLHPQVKDRVSEIEQVTIYSQRALLGIMDKTGPLHNPADRDHSVQYITAVGLIHGRLLASDYEDATASDPRIDALRARIKVVEDKTYTRDFYDPAKRSSANAMQVRFRDGSTTPKVVVEYPAGHPKRGAKAESIVRAKFEQSVSRRFAAKQRERIMALCREQKILEQTPVNEFMDAFAA